MGTHGTVCPVRHGADRHSRPRSPRHPRRRENNTGHIWTKGLDYWGDGRALMFRGPDEQIRRIAERTGARYVDAGRLRQWLGAGHPHGPF